MLFLAEHPYVKFYYKMTMESEGLDMVRYKVVVAWDYVKLYINTTESTTWIISSAKVYRYWRLRSDLNRYNPTKAKNSNVFLLI